MSSSRPLAVFHVLDMNPDKRGPVELQLAEMGRQLAARGGRQACCFSQAPPAWYADLLSSVNTSFHDIQDPGVHPAAVADLVERFRPDVVHVHFLHQARLFRHLRRPGRPRIVLTEHTFRHPQRHEPLRRVVRWGRAIHIARFIAVSRYTARQVQRDYLASPRRIRLVFNGVDLERFRPRADGLEIRRDALGLGPEALVVIAAHHLHPRKRLELLIRAFPAVLAEVPQAQLVIAGGGPDQARLAALIAQLGLEPHARIIGGGGRNRVDELYAASDIAVSSSDGEGLCGSAVEALACGLPLVATRAGGQVEVFEEGRSGLLVEPAVAERLTDAIVSLLVDRERRLAMGREARLRAERCFDVRRAARETLAVYDELLTRRRPAWSPR